MSDNTHWKTGKPVGSWQRGQGMHWWRGECTCGSGKEGYEVYDHHGIYFGISCSECKRGPYLHVYKIANKWQVVGWHIPLFAGEDEHGK